MEAITQRVKVSIRGLAVTGSTAGSVGCPGDLPVLSTGPYWSILVHTGPYWSCSTLSLNPIALSPCHHGYRYGLFWGYWGREVGGGLAGGAQCLELWRTEATVQLGSGRISYWVWPWLLLEGEEKNISSLAFSLFICPTFVLPLHAVLVKVRISVSTLSDLLIPRSPVCGKITTRGGRRKRSVYHRETGDRETKQEREERQIGRASCRERV